MKLRRAAAAFPVLNNSLSPALSILVALRSWPCFTEEKTDTVGGVTCPVTRLVSGGAGVLTQSTSRTRAHHSYAKPWEPSCVSWLGFLESCSSLRKEKSFFHFPTSFLLGMWEEGRDVESSACSSWAVWLWVSYSFFWASVSSQTKRRWMKHFSDM